MDCAMLCFVVFGTSQFYPMRQGYSPYQYNKKKTELQYFCAYVLYDKPYMVLSVNGMIGSFLCFMFLFIVILYHDYQHGDTQFHAIM